MTLHLIKKVIIQRVQFALLVSRRDKEQGKRDGQMLAKMLKL